jgi:Flp pilus assembly pilin Flp
MLEYSAGKGLIMGTLRNLLPDFPANEPGGRTIEYGLLAVGIVVACIAAAAALGGGLDASPQSAAYTRTGGIYPQLAGPLHINDRSTSLRQNQDSVGVGR